MRSLLPLVSLAPVIFGTAGALRIGANADHRHTRPRHTLRSDSLRRIAIVQPSKRTGAIGECLTPRGRGRPASVSPLLNAVPGGNTDDAKSRSVTTSFPYITPWARALLVFGLGYGLGGASAPGWQRQARMSKKIGATRILLAVLILRDVWRSTPQWAKPRITRYAKKLVNIVRLPFRRSNEDIEVEVEDADDLDDITDLSNFGNKLQSVIDLAKRRLELEDDDDEAEVKDDFNVQASFLAATQLLWQVKSRRAGARDQMYQFSGAAVPDELLEGMDEMFELADLAYDEHKDGDIKTVLTGMGYNLIKHDNNPVPGYLGHYVAINSDPSKKEAIIGVKGTSNLEDFLTDMCASSVEYNLTDAFYDGGSTTLRCHEGVFISSKRLAADLLPFIQNLLLPAGYKVVVTGHSLGAGCATLLSILLRAAIPSLQDPNQLKVWAFASPPVLDLKSALACSSFVTTVVNNCDAVPRANISPVVVTGRLLRAVNKRLMERNLDMSNFKSTIAFLNKMREGKDGEMLMSADDFSSELDSALERVELEDPDHLYVPGQVVILYDLWEKEQQRQQDGSESERDFTTVAKEWIQRVKNMDVHAGRDEEDVDAKNVPMAERAILSDGTCKVLRYIELDGRLLDDHMAPSYRSSIANVLSSRGSKSIEATEGTYNTYIGRVE